MSVVEELFRKSETICHLQNVSRLLSWDQQIMMPATKETTEVRGRQQAALALVVHERVTSEAFGDVLARAGDELGSESDSDAALVLARWLRLRRRALAVSPDLVERLALAQAEAFDAWRRAKEQSDFKVFCPHLKQIFALKREEAEQIGYCDHPYDAMLDEFEPGMKTQTVTALFHELRGPLADGVAKIMASPFTEALASGPLDQVYPVEGQHRMARRLTAKLGFPAANRLDIGPHPFCSASSSFDVRLVTRYHADEIGTALFATMHEAGHGLYELHSPARLEYTPLRGGCSLGVHESQSRLWENLVGRSRAFWGWAYRELREIYPRETGGYGVEDYYAAANRVRPSLIRVEADEVTYSLHVILRYEIELALLAGELEVEDVPTLWNEKMRSLLGVHVPTDALGCLQDVHWSDALVGYFPTYVLGNLIASDLWRRIEADVPQLTEDLSEGRFERLRTWLIQNLYEHAARYEPEVLLKKVLGHPIEVSPFLQYLKRKYSDLYQVEWS